MATLEEHLNTLSLKQIKNLVREHNLLSKIKIGQPKEALIARLLEHFEELVDGDMISSIYKIKIPDETDIVPKKGRKRIVLERPAIMQQQINPGEAVLRQMIAPKRKTGTLVSNNDKGNLQEAVRIPEEKVDEPEEGVEGAPPLEYMTDAEYDAEAKKLKEEISDLLDKSSLKDIMKVIDTYEYNAFTAKSKSAVTKFILYNFDGVEKAEKFLERWNKTLGMTGGGEHWERFKKIGIPILATAAAVGAAYAGHRAYQNNNRIVTYKGYNPDSHWTPGSYRELTQSEPRSLARIARELPIPPNAPPGSTSSSVTRDWARGIRLPPRAPAMPPPLTVIPYTRQTTRQPRIDLKAIINAHKMGDVSKLNQSQLERYARYYH